MRTIKYFLCLLLLLPVVIACKEDPIAENPSGETIIYNAYISNGGLSGVARYNGTIDEAAHTVTFNDVAAETDIQRIRLNGKISLGAHFDQESYDFYDPDAPAEKVLQKNINIVSGENQTEYKVIVNLSDAESKPMVSRIEVETAAGNPVTGAIDLVEKMIYLNTPNETEVTVKNLVLLPARTSYTLTNGNSNKLSKNDPGYIELEFWGKTDKYRIFFDDAPTAGIDFSRPVVHDFSTHSTVWSDFAAENTRSADFDGEYILLVSREGGPNPKLLRASEILANTSPTPIPLSTAGIAGGTYVISSGKLSQGHIYICNLTTGLADTDAGKLKLYHYATPASDPELILNFGGIVDGTALSTGRFGDNISIDLDEDGNGYAYFVHQTASEILRFTITGFTTAGEPVLTRPAMGATYYACYNKVGNEDAYLYTSTVAANIKLVDKDGAELAEITKLGDAKNATDAHVINYNSGRYLIMTSGRQQSAWPFPAFFIYDITEGFNTAAAFGKYTETNPDPVFTYKLGEVTQSACAGIAAWAAVDGKLCVLAAGPKVGFVLIEFPKNQK
jgi:hypothetical protein